MEKRIKVFVHRSKDSNRDLAEKLGFHAQNSRAHSEFSHAAEEVEILLDVDMETGKTKIVGCEGKFLSDESYGPGETEYVE